MNEIIVQAIHDTETCYGGSKYAEIVFKHETIAREKRMSVLDKRMETMDSNENGIYKFLGVEQADRIKTKVVFEHVKSEVEKRVKMLVNTELNDANPTSALNIKVYSCCCIFNEYLKIL